MSTERKAFFKATEFFLFYLNCDFAHWRQFHSRSLTSPLYSTQKAQSLDTVSESKRFILSRFLDKPLRYKVLGAFLGPAGSGCKSPTHFSADTFKKVPQRLSNI